MHIHIDHHCRCSVEIERMHAAWNQIEVHSKLHNVQFISTTDISYVNKLVNMTFMLSQSKSQVICLLEYSHSLPPPPLAHPHYPHYCKWAEPHGVVGRSDGGGDSWWGYVILLIIVRRGAPCHNLIISINSPSLSLLLHHFIGSVLVGCDDNSFYPWWSSQFSHLQSKTTGEWCVLSWGMNVFLHVYNYFWTSYTNVYVCEVNITRVLTSHCF